MFPFWKSNNLESLSTFGKKVEVLDVFNQKTVKIKLDPCLNIPEYVFLDFPDRNELGDWTNPGTQTFGLPRSGFWSFSTFHQDFAGRFVGTMQAPDTVSFVSYLVEQHSKLAAIH